MLDTIQVEVLCEICGQYRIGELNKETKKVECYCVLCDNDLSCEIIEE